jgi:hypothetical protein
MNIPTNLSVQNCDTRGYCGGQSSIQPRPWQSCQFQVLNSDAGTFAKGFKPVRVDNRPMDPACLNAVVSADPRLYDAARGITMPIDRPPYDSTVLLKNINTDVSLDNYGKGYRTYSDINAGQIVYYIDKSIADPFFDPLFTIPSETYSTVYRDPMSNLKPTYYRKPDKDCLSNPTLLSNCNPCQESTTWFRDSQNHREDLLARKMQKFNQTKWSARWAS